MIYEEEKTVDEMVDDILGSDADESEARSAGPADGKRIYLNRCKDCRQTFETPYVGGKYCPACKRRRISAGQKARQAKVHAKEDQASCKQVASELQVSSDNPTPPEREPEDPVKKAWAELREESGWQIGPVHNQDDKRDRPEDMETDELLRVMADGLRRDTGDVILSLYETIRSVAKAGGMDPGQIVQALYEMDCILDRVGRRTQE